MATHTAPAFTLDDARALARTHFAIDADAAPLPSERDQNFLLSISGSAKTQLVGPGPAYVLKLSQAGESRDLLDCQHQAIATLNAAATRFSFPRLRPSVEGDEIVEVNGGDGTAHWARVVEYLPREPLARITPQTPAVLREVGAMLGTVDRVLRGFVHPAAERSLNWALQLASSVITRFIDEVTERRGRARVERALSILDASAPLFESLRKSIIHNDGNDYNIIAQPPNAAAPFEPVRVVGLIDFGDLVYSWTLAELAVGVAYTMLGKADPLGEIGRASCRERV